MEEGSIYAPILGYISHIPATQYSLSPFPYRTLQEPDELRFLPLG